MPHRRPRKSKNQQPPSPPLSGNSISTASGSGGGQVLTFRNPTLKVGDILELVQTAEIEWNLNFGYLRFTKDLEGGPPEMIEVANWIEEILEVEIVQFVMVPGSDIGFIVRKKRK